MMFPLVFRRRAASESSRWSAAFRWWRCEVRKKEQGRSARGWAPRDPAPLFIDTGGVVGRGFLAPAISVTVACGAVTARVVRNVGERNRQACHDRSAVRRTVGARNPNRTRVTGRSDGSWDPQDGATVPRVFFGSEKEAFGGRFVRIRWRTAKYLGAVVITSALESR